MKKVFYLFTSLIFFNCNNNDLLNQDLETLLYSAKELYDGSQTDESNINERLILEYLFNPENVNLDLVYNTEFSNQIKKRQTELSSEPSFKELRIEYQNHKRSILKISNAKYQKLYKQNKKVEKNQKETKNGVGQYEARRRLKERVLQNPNIQDISDYTLWPEMTDNKFIYTYQLIVCHGVSKIDCSPKPLWAFTTDAGKTWEFGDSMESEWVSRARRLSN